jgi:hypothetical protein
MNVEVLRHDVTDIWALMHPNLKISMCLAMSSSGQ